MASSKDRFVYPSSSISYGRTKFKMPHKHKTSFFHGQLIPLDAFEVLPGDTFKLSIASLIRMSTPIAPIMDDIEMHIAAYFVPNRIVFENWEELNGANKTGAWYNLNNFNIEVPHYGDYDPNDLAKAYADFGFVLADVYSYVGTNYQGQNHNYASNGVYLNQAFTNFVNLVDAPCSIGSYLFSPVRHPISGCPISCLPGRCYFTIWNENYRNQNVTAPFLVDKSSANRVLVAESSVSSVFAANLDGHGYPNAYNLPCLPLGKHPDYFTKCLPGPQKAPDVGFLSGFAPVGAVGLSNGSGSAVLQAGIASSFTAVTGQFEQYQTLIESNGVASSYYGKAVADLAASTQNTINALRTAFQLQKFYEKDARGGTRYFEMLNAHFGVKNADLVLQRPEYLGEINFRINIDQVLSHAGYAAGSSTELGVPGANSTTGGRGSLFTKSFTEHGWIIIVGGTRHNHTYSRMIHKSYNKISRLDYYDPVFANVGEQPVNKYEFEPMAGTFGYQEAWAEYRFIPDKVTGILNPYVANSLNFWTLAERDNNNNSLANGFIYENRYSIEDALTTGAVGPDFIGDFLFDLTAVREMPLFSIPGLVDHH